MLNWKIVSLAIGAWAAVSFIVCVAWGLLVPEALHMHGFLQLILPGFQWLSPGMFLLGLFESLAFGIYAGTVYVPIYNFLVKRFG